MIGTFTDEIGLCSVHRWLESNTGRYTRPDPLGLDEGDLTQYAYPISNPRVAGAMIAAAGKRPVVVWTRSFLAFAALFYWLMAIQYIAVVEAAGDDPSGGSAHQA
jgi:uncharacterized protein RhaS with RHS repeats